MTYGGGDTGTPLRAPLQHTWASPLAQPPHALGATIPQAAPQEAHLRLPPVPTKGRAPWLWIWIVLAVLAVAVVGYFVSSLGAVGVAITSILALIPFAGVILTVVLVIDRWEPEPRSLIVFALAWGAVAAIALTLLTIPFLDGIAGAWGMDPLMAEILSIILRAPLLEEGWKLLGILLVLWMARNAFDGPVDGIVYGMLVGAGFAFTENIQYFVIALYSGGIGGLAENFFMRGVMSPFAHAMFTGAIGLMIGLARRGGRSVPLFALLGYVLGVALHALWNASSVLDLFFPNAFYTLYALVEVPIFVLFIVCIVQLRKEEMRLTRERLGEYAEAGWFTRQEVDMLATADGRRAGKRWAASRSAQAVALMNSFIRDATALAMARQRARSGRDPGAVEDEHLLLHRAAATRRALLAP
ncbi:PrsW family intramembrane metalloprotease [Microbacterium sp. Marseille-Q6965]|uniref:PrsW family intramembrane metalloprotease n=1 Tax=Microbacterium sp. Marseille-Q6965 TaxID=2965072 RepID=UPI0021B78A77|nr:PrsW family intramembrane metalloprotease [Microbacterium sp. Marseille-Q6965]